MTDGHVAGSASLVADVKRPLMSVAKVVAAGNRVHTRQQGYRRVMSFLCGKAGSVFVIDLCVRKDATSWTPGLQPAGLRSGVCVTDEGQTMRAVRSAKWWRS